MTSITNHLLAEYGVLGIALFFSMAILSYFVKKIVEKQLSQATIALKHELSKETQALASANDRTNAVLESLLRRPESITSRQREKRAEALDEVWNAAVWLVDQIPSAVPILGSVHPDKYPSFRRSPRAESELSEWNHDYLAKKLLIANPHTPKVRSLRIYLPDSIWFIFYSLQAAIGRVVHIIAVLPNHSSDAPKNWRDDEHLATLFLTALGSEGDERLKELQSPNQDLQALIQEAMSSLSRAIFEYIENGSTEEQFQNKITTFQRVCSKYRASELQEENPYKP